MSDRLRAINWTDNSGAFDHPHSRALLMREYLCRSALRAKAYDAETSWPFFDIAEHIDAEITISPHIAEELEDLLEELAPASLRTTCRGAVRWAALREARDDLSTDLPDPYEPLLAMYERGGGYYLEEYLDLNGVMIPLRDVESNASAPAFLTLAPAALDALDAEGGDDVLREDQRRVPSAQPARDLPSASRRWSDVRRSLHPQSPLRADRITEAVRSRPQRHRPCPHHRDRGCRLH
ncbi:hypothetical protein ACIRJR_10335 [Streptomyces sp. NPDC102402]|uniref:hypothetical protein n=1 Tax=Streptomyces sp. NPDC102402 TaxID=3366169 RepID=UPI003829546C